MRFQCPGQFGHHGDYPPAGQVPAVVTALMGYRKVPVNRPFSLSGNFFRSQFLFEIAVPNFPRRLQQACNPAPRWNVDINGGRQSVRL